jgi:hypothetical protein
MSEHFFSGKASWARMTTPDKFGKYSVTIALDMKQFKEMKDLGIKNGGKPNEDGHMLVTFRRPQDTGPPKVVDRDGAPFTKDIGNGSTCTVALDVETFTSKVHGKVTRSTLTKVRVDEWVEYVPTARTDVPGSDDARKQGENPSPSALPTPKGRMF